MGPQQTLQDNVHRCCSQLVCVHVLFPLQVVRPEQVVDSFGFPVSPDSGICHLLSRSILGL